MDRGVDDEQVVRTVDLGVQVYNRGAVVHKSRVGAHLRGADPVVACDVRAEDVAGVAAAGEGDGRVGGRGAVDEVLQEPGCGGRVGGRGQPGCGHELGDAVGGDAEDARRGGAVGEEGLDADDARGDRGDGSLEETLGAVEGVVLGCPQVETLAGLGESAGSLCVQVLI